MELFVRDLKRAIDGKLKWSCMPPCDRENTALSQIRIDSREVQTGDVFWALPGTQHHGADFANDAFMRGATLVVTDRRVEPMPGAGVVSVEDAQLALWQLARWCREHFSGVMIGIAGSVGKTTTREMIHAILRCGSHGSASPKNYNNHIGVPLSVLAVQPTDDYAVLELGASRAGEIDALGQLVQPSIGVIGRLGDAHLGGFGDTDSIAASKTELLATLPDDGCAVISGDDPRLQRMAGDCRAEVVLYGRSVDCDIMATHVQSGNGRLRFRACEQSFCLPVWGRHHLDAALAAIAVGRLMDYPLPEIADALAEFTSVPMRCEVLQASGVTLINDTYNSSPLAAKAALALLREFGTSGRRIVVSGDMLELGEASERLHYQLGQQVVTTCGADRLLACGEMAECVAEGARLAGMPASCIGLYATAAEAIEPLRAQLVAGDVLLAKGSRAMGLEQVVAALISGASAQAA